MGRNEPGVPELTRLYGAEWLARAVGAPVDRADSIDKETRNRLTLIANLTRRLSGFYGDGRAFRAWWERRRPELDGRSPLEHLGASWSAQHCFDVQDVMSRMAIPLPMVRRVAARNAGRGARERRAHQDRALTMASISAVGVEPWFVSRATLRVLLERVATLCPDDREALEGSMALDSLDFKYLDREEALRIAECVLRVSREVRDAVAGSIHQTELQPFASRLPELERLLVGETERLRRQ